MSRSTSDRRTNIEEAVRWLVDRADFGSVTPDVSASLLPKMASYLLPFSSINQYNEMVDQHIPTAPLQKLAHRFLVRRFKFKNERRDWPKTMELDFLHGVVEPELTLEKRPICMVMSMGSYGSVILKLAEVCHAEGLHVCILVPSNVDKTIFSNLTAEISIISFESFQTDAVVEKYETKIEELSREYEDRYLAQMTRAPSLVQDIFKICPDQLKYVVTKVMPQVGAFQGLAEEVYRQLNPAALLVTRLKRITENVCAYLAKGRKLPVLLVNHGHVGTDWNYWSLGRVDRYCDAVYLWNDGDRVKWSALFPRMDQRKLKVVGGLQWDEAISQRMDKSDSRFQIAEAIGFEPDLEEVTWITITMDGFIRPTLGAVLEALTKIVGVRIFIKARPTENRDDYQNITPHIADNVHLVTSNEQVNLFTLLCATDVVLACVSTTNFDALVAQVPVVTMALTPQSQADERAQLLRSFGLPWVTTVQELYEELLDYINSESRRHQLTDCAEIAVRALLANYPEGNAQKKILRDLRLSLSGGNLCSPSI